MAPAIRIGRMGCTGKGSFVWLNGRDQEMYRHALLLAAALMVCAGSTPAQNADTVDGFDAYSTPHANALLALDGSGHFPVSVIPDDSIPGGKLKPGAVTAGRLADNSVTSSKITNGAILGEDIGIPLLMGGSRNGYLIGCFNSSSGSATSGVTGYSTAATGATRGVVGASNSTAGKGVYGVAKAASGLTYGVYGESNSTDGIGVFGYATAATGYATGLYGRSNSPSGRGVFGYNGYSRNEGYLAGAAYGAKGWNYDSQNYGFLGGPSHGVYGYNGDTGNYGLLGGYNGAYGESYTTAAAIMGANATPNASAKAIYGYCPSGYGGYFAGNLYASGTFTCPDKQFKIDHPLDPENMYLEHACVESSERKNVYDGTVVLDARGEAWIELPDWFEALNCDFRYQLTPIGAPAPNLYIAQKIANGCFAIAGGVPGMEVSWQVTGVRQDPYALAHPLQVEVEKPETERGYYLHPDVYGVPETLGIDWALDPKGMTEMSTQR
jgi:hypothetical protein